MPLLQKRHVLTLALRVIACLREKGYWDENHHRTRMTAGKRSGVPQRRINFLKVYPSLVCC
ncbi:MAG: hypothetical protein E6Z80_14850 [Citrobacter freundii]|nr:hypothetical protein [Citrobacter freundii]